MDLIVKLPEAYRPGDDTAYDSIHVSVDRLTKQADFTPWKETWDAATSAERLRDVLVVRHGLPFEIITDRGSVFTSKQGGQVIANLSDREHGPKSFVIAIAIAIG